MKYSEFKRWLQQQGAVLTPSQREPFQSDAKRENKHISGSRGKGNSKAPDTINQKRLGFEIGDTMLRYPVTLTTDNETNTVMADFPDVPWCHSAGYDESEALLNAEDALTSALGVFIEKCQAIPEPSEIKSDQAHITLTALTTAKILLWNEMTRQGIRKSDLARQLNCHMPQIDRLLDFEHSSKIELVETALRLLGKQLNVQLAA